MFWKASLWKAILWGKLFHRCFLRNMTTGFTIVTLENTTYFLLWSICCGHLVFYCLTKYFELVYAQVRFAVSECYSLFLSLSVWLKMWRVLTCRVHMNIFAGAVWKFIDVPWRYILKLAEVLHIRGVDRG